MAVAVYPHLDALLRDRGLSVLELKRTIEERYGLAVDLPTLQRLAGSEPVEQTDLTLAGAVATVLGVSLNDLFSVEESPTDRALPTGGSYLSDEASERLSELFMQRDDGTLDEDGTRELHRLVDEYGRNFREVHLRSYAAKQGISFEEAVRQSDQEVARASKWLHDLDATPGARQAFIEQVKQRRSSAAN